MKVYVDKYKAERQHSWAHVARVHTSGGAGSPIHLREIDIYATDALPNANAGSSGDAVAKGEGNGLIALTFENNAELDAFITVLNGIRGPDPKPKLLVEPTLFRT